MAVILKQFFGGLDLMLHQHYKGYMVQLSSLTGGGRHQVSLCTLFHARVGTCVGPPDVP